MARAADKSCAVCLAESAQNPRQVPCGNGHVFCLNCLEGLVAHAATVQDNSFPCPTCRNRVDIPARGVAAFPSLDKAGSPQPASPFPPTHRFGNRPFPRRHRRPPGSADAAREDRGPLFPFPLPRPRRVNTPLHARARDRFDLEMDSPESGPQNGYRRPPLPDMPFLPFSRSVLEPREGQRFRGRAAEPVRSFVDHPDDLDMEEVMLVIAQMEEQEKMKLAQQDQDQDEMLRLHFEVNEEEDRLETLRE